MYYIIHVSTKCKKNLLITKIVPHGNNGLHSMSCMMLVKPQPVFTCRQNSQLWNFLIKQMQLYSNLHKLPRKSFYIIHKIKEYSGTSISQTPIFQTSISPIPWIFRMIRKSQPFILLSISPLISWTLRYLSFFSVPSSSR